MIYFYNSGCSYQVVSQFEKNEPYRHIGHNRMTHSLCGTLCFYCFYVVQKAFHNSLIQIETLPLIKSPDELILTLNS